VVTPPTGRYLPTIVENTLDYSTALELKASAAVNRSMTCSALMRRLRTTCPMVEAESDKASDVGLTSTIRTASSTRYSHNFSPCSQRQMFRRTISGLRRQAFSFQRPPNSQTRPILHPSARKKYFTTAAI